MTEPTFPPLFQGRAAAAGVSPLAAAVEAAAAGCDAGLVLHQIAPDRLQAAIVFAPETPLEQAVIALPLCGVGFQNALGALAPPEVGVHLGWDGRIWVNGGHCGDLSLRASTTNPQDVPDWLVIGLDLPLWPESEETGLTPDRTALYAEGCAEVDPTRLLEAWIRHTLVGLSTWEDGGTATLHREWTGLAHGIGTEITTAQGSGHFLGVDENFGLLLKQDGHAKLIPLTALLKDTP